MRAAGCQGPRCAREWHHRRMLAQLRAMPGGVRIFLGYAFLILGLIGLSLRWVVDQAISAPVSLPGVVVMVLLAYTIFTTTLVLQRKEASRTLALGLSTLTMPAIPLLLLAGQPIAALDRRPARRAPVLRPHPARGPRLAGPALAARAPRRVGPRDATLRAASWPPRVRRARDAILPDRSTAPELHVTEPDPEARKDSGQSQPAGQRPGAAARREPAPSTSPTGTPRAGRRQTTRYRQPEPTLLQKTPHAGAGADRHRRDRAHRPVRRHGGDRARLRVHVRSTRRCRLSRASSARSSPTRATST